MNLHNYFFFNSKTISHDIKVWYLEICGLAELKNILSFLLLKTDELNILKNVFPTFPSATISILEIPGNYII